jgi:hypothetical protein
VAVREVLSLTQCREVTLVHWRVFDVPFYGEGRSWTRHLAGWSWEEQQGCVSFPIRSFDPLSGQFETFSGRLFRLVGRPGLNGAAIFVWAAWKALSGVFEERDVTDEVVAAMDEVGVQLREFIRRE